MTEGAQRVLVVGEIASDDLAYAMVQAGLNGTANHDDPVLESRAIRAMAI